MHPETAEPLPGSLPVANKARLSIDCYFHVSDHRGWQELVTDKISQIKRTGLWSRLRNLRFQLCYNKDSYTEFLDSEIFQDRRVQAVFLADSHRPLGECYSIIDMHREIQLCAEPHAVLRISTKGLTHRWDETWQTAQQWNQYYDYWLLDQWELNYQAICAGHDASGANWHPWGEPQGHFSGTQFWAHSEYLRTLEPLKPPHTVNFEQQLASYSPRHDAEVWLGQGSPRILELHHYQHAVVYHVSAPQNYRLPKDPI